MIEILRYIVLPKGVRSVFRKIVYYLPGTVSGLFIYPATTAAAILVLTFVVLEFGIGTLRRQLNDFRDFEADKRRGHRWSSAIHLYPRSVLAYIILLKSAALIIIVTILIPQCINVSLVLIASQLVHDWWGRGRSAVVCMFAIACAYCSRAIAPWIAISFHELVPVSLLGFAGSMLAVSNTLDWKNAEKLYLDNAGLERKESVSLRAGTIAVISCLATVLSAICASYAFLSFRKSINGWDVILGILVSVTTALLIIACFRYLIPWLSLSRTVLIAILVMPSGLDISAEYTLWFVSVCIPCLVVPMVLKSDDAPKAGSYFQSRKPGKF